MKKIILVGYMGSGKSLIGKLLSEKTGIKFFDLDQIIEQRENQIIKKIFDTKGEIYFRKLEHNVFLELLQSNDDIILSCGGGTPCYYNNHELLNESNLYSIYLQGSIDTLYNRLILETNKRPLISGIKEPELKEYIAKQLFERSYFYNFSNFKINIDNKTPESIVSEVQKLLT